MADDDLEVYILATWEWSAGPQGWTYIRQDCRTGEVTVEHSDLDAELEVLTDG